MKQTLLSAAFALASFAAIAQLTLTGINNNPIAGDVYVGHSFDTTGIAAGASGAAVTWNFGTVASTGTDTMSFVSCLSTTYCDSFAGSNLATFDGTDHTFAITSSSKFSVIGAHSDTNFIHFSNSRDIMRYPFTYNSMYKDTSVIPPAGLPVTLSSVDSNYADAYGTLILPTGTYTNVLRVHTTTVNTYLVSGFPLGSDRQERYSWYKPGIHYPLMYLVYDTADGSRYMSDNRYYTGPAYTTGITSINTVAENLNVFPNPATNDMHITFNIGRADDASVMIADLTGRTIGTISNLSKGVNDISYSVAELPAGMYIIHLHTVEGNVSQKFVVSK